MKRLCASILGQENKIDLVNKLIQNGITWIHYDLMDGNFVPKKSMPIEQISQIVNNTDAHVVDIHLMTTMPMQCIQKSRYIAEYLTFHFETENIESMKKIFKDFGKECKIGIALNPKTNVEQIYEFLDRCSHILIMSVQPGAGGQEFMPKTLDKIKKIKKYIDDHNYDVFIQVDGGINDKTGPLCIEAGASVLVSGSYLINNLSENIESKIIG